MQISGRNTESVQQNLTIALKKLACAEFSVPSCEMIEEPNKMFLIRQSISLFSS
jgi:hypothetical protein